MVVILWSWNTEWPRSVAVPWSWSCSGLETPGDQVADQRETEKVRRQSSFSFETRCAVGSFISRIASANPVVQGQNFPSPAIWATLPCVAQRSSGVFWHDISEWCPRPDCFVIVLPVQFLIEINICQKVTTLGEAGVLPITVWWQIGSLCEKVRVTHSSVLLSLVAPKNHLTLATRQKSRSHSRHSNIAMWTLTAAERFLERNIPLHTLQLSTNSKQKQLPIWHDWAKETNIRGTSRNWQAVSG